MSNSTKHSKNCSILRECFAAASTHRCTGHTRTGSMTLNFSNDTFCQQALNFIRLTTAVVEWSQFIVWIKCIYYITSGISWVIVRPSASHKTLWYLKMTSILTLAISCTVSSSCAVKKIIGGALFDFFHTANVLEWPFKASIYAKKMAQLLCRNKLFHFRPTFTPNVVIRSNSTGTTCCEGRLMKNANITSKRFERFRTVGMWRLQTHINSSNPFDVAVYIREINT